MTSTKPLLISGRAVNGLRVRFEGGRAVEIDADEGAPLLRELVARDADANRLGEVALVDSSGRIGAQRDRVSRHTARRERRQPHRARLRLHASDAATIKTAASDQCRAPSTPTS